MTCKDCIHYEVCKIWNNNIPSEYEGVEFRCDCFKMNNYKELVAELEELSSLNDENLQSLIIENNDLQNALVGAAAAIEQLTR